MERLAGHEQRDELHRLLDLICLPAILAVNPEVVPVDSKKHAKNECLEASSIEQLVGSKITVFPNALHNKKRLFTLQDGTYIDKLTRSLTDEQKDGEVKAWISKEKVRGKEKVILTIGDGNHTVARACLNGAPVEITIVGMWDPKFGKRYGFNKIISDYKAQAVLKI